MQAQPVLITLHDASRGFELTPERVPLAVLREFTRDVEDLIRGDGKQVDTAALEVSVVKGSLGVLTTPLTAMDLMQDLLSLIGSDLIDGLQTKRRDVVEKWQKMAKGSRQIQIKIASAALPRSIVIDANTDYRSDDADQWVAVERYIRGEIFDLGGKHAVNAHIQLPDGKKLVVETSRETIRADKINRLFKPSMVRIKAEYNVSTREYRNARLLEFVEYDNKLDESAMARLTERGAIAWKDVPNATQWVEELRGGTD